MKKTVIKRRKRVPAASGGSSGTVVPVSPTTGRLTEQAAAEALVSVGRVQERVSGEESGGLGADEDEEEEMEPKRKRVRRSVVVNGKAESVPIARRRSTRTRTATRELGSTEGRDDEDDVDAGMKRRRKGASSHRQDAVMADSRAGSLSRSSSRATLIHEVHMDRYGRGYSSASPALHSSSHVGGFDLPPLNAAINGGEMSHMVLGMSGPGTRGLVFPTSAGYVGGTSGREFGSSYIRSGSAAPSRAHSPSNPGVPNFVLPPLHHHSSQQTSSHRYGSTSPHNHHHSTSYGVPTIPELERHYYQLGEERRRLEEMLEKTDRLMTGVRRGMDELRERELALSASQQTHQQQSSGNAPSPPSSAPPAPAMPLARSVGLNGRESVWNVTSTESSTRD
jgi:GATA-binding protein, other eukaryote